MIVTPTFSPKRFATTAGGFFDGEQAFQLLYDSPKARLVGADELVAMMDEQGIDKAVTFGFPWVSADTYKRHNDYILEAVGRYPDRLIGLGCFDAAGDEAPKEAERCLRAGLSGVGELAFYCSDMVCGSRDGLGQVLALCRQFDCPVMIHTNEPVGHAYPGKTDNTLAQIYAIAKHHPQNRIIFAHWGGGLFFFNLLKKEVGSVMENVWFDTAASPFLYRPEIYRHAIAMAGADKILLGTDFPLLPPSRYFKEMCQAGISPEHQQLISGGNAAALFGL